jgi:hypothetical protein
MMPKNVVALSESERLTRQSAVPGASAQYEPDVPIVVRKCRPMTYKLEGKST